MCRWLYDPAHFNDRLLLGLKGAMSEAELHVLKARLRGGILSRARRGELKQMFLSALCMTRTIVSSSIRMLRSRGGASVLRNL